MALTVEEYKKIFETPETLVQYFNYFMYDSEDKIFINRDGSMARLYDISPVASDFMSDEAVKTKAKLIKGILLREPEKTIIQALLFCDDKIEEPLQKYRSFGQESDDPNINLYVKEKTDLFLKGRDSLFNYQGYPYSVKRIKVYFSIIYKPDWVSPSFYDKTIHYLTGKNTLRKRFKENYNKQLKEFITRCEIAESVFNGARVEYGNLGPQELIDFLYKFFNPTRAKNIPPQRYRDDIPLNEQFLRSPVENEFWALSADGIKTHVLTLPQLPLNDIPGLFTREGKPGTGREGLALMDMFKGLVYCLNIYIPDQSKEDSSLNWQRFRADFQGDRSIGPAEIKKDIDQVKKDMFRLGERIIFSRAHFLIRGETEREIDSRSTALTTALSSLGCEAIREEFIAPSLVLSCMPFHFDPQFEKGIQRGIKNEAQYINNLTPFFGTFRGTKTPMHMFLNRRGEICYFDLFGEGNPHCVITGASRSGKSFLVNAIIMDALRKGSLVFVIDKGHSYRKLFKIMNGFYMSVDMDNPICMNPFRERDLDARGLNTLTSLFAEMISRGDERERLRGEELALLQEGIKEVYKIKSDQQHTISEFRKVLAKMGDIGISLSRRLGDFSKGGSYGGFFDGQDQCDFNNRLIGFELGDITDDLMSPILLTIMTAINARLRDVNRAGARAYSIIDEAWSIMKSQHCAKFIENDFRTKAKLHCSCIAITQQTEELNNAAGMAILGNSRNKFFLQQPSEVIPRMKKLFEMSDTEISALLSLKKEWKRFSEVLVKTDELYGVIRYVPDPFTYWVSTSQAPDNRYLDTQLEKYNGDYVKAISETVKEKPYGVE